MENANVATSFEIHTPPVENWIEIIHRGRMDIKWISPF
jgi:hypothetical protein